MAIFNQSILDHDFLQDMYNDGYFPDNCVDLVKEVLLKLCQSIEDEVPKTLEELYQLTDVATEEINELQEVFEDADSEIETVARDAISTDVLFIAQSYGFTEADIESVVRNRDW
ncbi:DUF5713 family protein [Pseudomonas sp. F1_0610]|uniref:DUF5713 family protein n=1 Tax=Pseudomonas sp. F1_0610 TaxID=3114284 RepID=UPI0039C0071D